MLDGAPESTLLVVEQLSRGRKKPLTPQVAQLVLWRVISCRECILCGAEVGQLCMVYGGFSNIMRTHPVRLRMTRMQRSRAVAWALGTSDSAAVLLDDDDDDLP